MSSLIKALRRSSLKHKKLGEEWGDESREVVLDGISFFVKYIGCSLVEEAKGQTSTALAIKTIVHMAKSKVRKLDRVSVTVSPRGVRVVNPLTRDVLLDVPIYRISYCSADASYDHVFAFVSANGNDTFDCHAFLCPKKKVAHAVTLTIAQAFRLAFESWQNGVGDSNEGRDPCLQTGSDQMTTVAAPSPPPQVLLIDFGGDDDNISAGHSWEDFDCDVTFQKFIEARYDSGSGSEYISVRHSHRGGDLLAL